MTDKMKTNKLMSMTLHDLITAKFKIFLEERNLGVLEIFKMNTIFF